MSPSLSAAAEGSADARDILDAACALYERDFACHAAGPAAERASSPGCAALVKAVVESG